MAGKQTAQSAQKMWDALTTYIEDRKNDCDCGEGIITYGHLGHLIGYKSPAGQPAGQTVKYLNSYCAVKNLPRITSVVVSKTSSAPAWLDMFASESEFLAEQARVLEHRWRDEPSPTVEALVEARTIYENGGF